jgi:predicted GNAT superfamily acetyltransferase
MAGTSGIVVRRPAAPEDYRRLQDVQRAAWGIVDDAYVVPIATLVGADRHGGLVLGAWTPEGEAVGVSFAFLARVRGRLGLYSQLTGIRPSHQNRGIGKRLKLAQRDFAREQGLELIAWAFDPLQAVNARFNLGTLGAVAREYVVDMYGPRTDALNAGLPTDRLIVEWETEEAPWVPLSREAVEAPKLVADAWGEPDRSPLPGGARFALVELPPDVGALRRTEPERAARWQAAVRASFLEAFAAGMAATRVVVGRGDERHVAYLLGPPARPPVLISGPDDREDKRRA